MRSIPNVLDNTCCVCEKQFVGWGNNPAPLMTDGECCNKCNSVVLFIRLFGNRQDLRPDVWVSKIREGNPDLNRIYEMFPAPAEQPVD